MFFLWMILSILRTFMQWDLPNSLISFHSYFTKWQCFRNIRNPFKSTTQNKGDKFKSNICSLYEWFSQSCGRSCSGIFRILWYLFTPISRNAILFICQASIAYRALQKVSKPVDIHLLQWHSSVISIHNRYLDFCTATNVHKNILEIMLCWPA